MRRRRVLFGRGPRRWTSVERKDVHRTARRSRWWERFCATMVVAALSGTLAVQAQLSGIKDGDLAAVGSIAGELRVPQGSDRSLAGVVVRVMETDAASAV